MADPVKLKKENPNVIPGGADVRLCVQTILGSLHRMSDISEKFFNTGDEDLMALACVLLQGNIAIAKNIQFIQEEAQIIANRHSSPPP